MKPSVYLLILTWNAKKVLLECLESVFKLDYPNLKIVVMDNGGTDGTPAAVRELYGERVTLIENGENLHFARGNNPGIEFALRERADYLMLLNDDVIVDPKMVTTLVESIERDSRIGVIGPKVYYEHPPDQIWFAGGLVHLYKGTSEHIGIREKDAGQYDLSRDVDYITGCALMIRREVVEQIGPLDPAFLIYWEDTDWCMKTRRAGYRVVYEPAAKMWHKISASRGGQLSKYKIRNKLRSAWIFHKRYARWYHWLTIPFFFSLDTLRILWMMATGGFKRGYRGS